MSGEQRRDLEAEIRATRRKLPDERQSITYHFCLAGHDAYLHVGLYEDGTPGELFLDIAKEGSTVSGLCDSFAKMASLALQHGCPLQRIVDHLKGAQFEPSGYHDGQHYTSIADIIARYLEKRFLNSAQSAQAETPSNSITAAEQQNVSDSTNRPNEEKP